MECNRWVEEGLLYTSGELEKHTAAGFEKHLQTCAECKRELETYLHEKKSFYSSELLETPTSPELDRKVKEACAKIPRPSAGVSLFSIMVRKGVMPFLFLLVGFSGGVCLAFNIDRDGFDDVRVAQENQGALQPPPAPVVSAANDDVLAEASESNEVASSSDSTDKATPSLEHQRRGNIGAQGGVPVDLQNK